MNNRPEGELDVWITGYVDGAIGRSGCARESVNGFLSSDIHFGVGDGRYIEFSPRRSQGRASQERG